MAWTYDQTITASWEENETARARANAELEAARQSEDYEAFRLARNDLFVIDQKAAWIAQKANVLHAQQTVVPPGTEDLSRRDQDLCRHYGLRPADLPLAKGWTSDASIPDTQRIETYLQNRQRLANMRANGTYATIKGR